MADFLSSSLGLALVAVFLGASMIKITREYERGVIFRLGRLAGVRGPGLFFLIPLIEKMVKMDLRVVALDVPPQDVITRDNIPVKIDAVLYFRVSDPAKAVTEVEHFIVATSQIAQTSLRGVAGEAAFDELLAEREKINSKLHHIIDEATDPWGVKVTAVEVKHVEIPEAMQRAIAKQAEAERMRRAKVILAEGEYQAAQKLKEAGQILGADPITLRYLETLSEAAKEPNTTILFPAEMLGFIKKLGGKER
jgi:regulator of protease activity HflC (stomatin/prohibitin superfamily)